MLYCYTTKLLRESNNIIYLRGMLMAPMHQVSNMNCDHEQYGNHQTIVL